MKVRFRRIMKIAVRQSKCCKSHVCIAQNSQINLTVSNKLLSLGQTHRHGGYVSTSQPTPRNDSLDIGFK